jgi:hypothetical protein
MIAGGIITWVIRSRMEESRAIRQKLNEDRRKTYSQILEPYIRVFADIKGQGPAQAVTQIKSYEHKKTSFDLVLFGSDNVIKAYNNFLQFGYNVETSETSSAQRGKAYMQLWGKLLLEIRKDVGNEETELSDIDMLRWLIIDIHKLENPKD